MTHKRKPKEEKEKRVLFALVDLYLLTGKAVGSNALRTNGLENISPATIRNYFAKLESQGFLKQQHSSGGRIPTDKTYRLYAAQCMKNASINPKDLEFLKKELDRDTREIARYLEHASEVLSGLTECAIFLSSPRFDHDFITDIKVMGIDGKRCLCVLITDFGLIHTEILSIPKRLSTFALKRMEAYFHFRMTGLDRPKLSKQEEVLSSKLYNEILLRHIVNYSNFSAEDTYATGFSNLLRHPEFRDATVLASSLSLFENTSYMRILLQTCLEKGELTFWIGNDLNQPGVHPFQSSVIAIPYCIHGKPVGAIALLGPTRMPYAKLFGTLQAFSQVVSAALTRNLYKYKITYREPRKEEIDFKTNHPAYVSQAHTLMLENQS